MDIALEIYFITSILQWEMLLYVNKCDVKPQRPQGWITTWLYRLKSLFECQIWVTFTCKNVHFATKTFFYANIWIIHCIKNSNYRRTSNSLSHSWNRYTYLFKTLSTLSAICFERFITLRSLLLFIATLIFVDRRLVRIHGFHIYSPIIALPAISKIIDI